MTTRAPQLFLAPDPEGERVVFPRSTIPRQIRRARARSAPPVEPLPPDRLYAPMQPVGLAQAEQEWRGWFAGRGWEPFDYQHDAWEAYARGGSGLIVLPTGSGKTLAALGGPLQELRAEGTLGPGDELRVIYLSPLKALVRDVEKAIRGPIEALGWGIRVETRTGDSTERSKRRQATRLPHVLITTPESLGLLVTQPGWRERMRRVRAVVIDEWHELLGSRRGSLLELMLARLRSAAPQVRTWAVSATLEDPALAARVAVGAGRTPEIVQAAPPRDISIRAILPDDPARMPWFGHYGLSRVPDVIAELDPRVSTLIFTNTRAQAERWYSAILATRPEWEGRMGLHHGSLDRAERERVENAVKDGTLPFVVATSSLDLGVDFPAVQKVIQIGSIKGIARATQRAGRAFHRPGEPTSLTVCPTHFLEYLEVAALREAIADGVGEPRAPLERPLDVLVQFTLSSALAEGFESKELLAVVRSAYSFRDVADSEFAWVLSFITTGGHTLRAYPQFQKVAIESDGIYRFVTPRLARHHRLGMGTIVSEAGVQVRFQGGARLGQIDEGFVAKLKRGDVFTFAGRALEFVRMRDLTAYVTLARRKSSVATVWGGNSLPITPALSEYMKKVLAGAAGEAPAPTPELDLLSPLFDVQRRRSAIPAGGQTLVERLDSREGHHLFVFTWEGRAVNEGLGHLLAYRLGRLSANTVAVSANDHGFECLATLPYPEDKELRALFAAGPGLEAEIEQSLNYPELARSAFREIARVSGLLLTGPPSERKSTRQLQMSASLLFDVFRQYDPGHPLLRESFAEVRRRQLDFPRMKRVLEEIEAGELLLRRPDRLTPFAFPLYVERVRSRVSTEALADRIERMRKRVFAP